VSRASAGAFDVTVAPLVRLWGFGPDARPGVRPSEESIARAAGHVGWEKLAVTATTLRKLDPALTLDFSAIAKGRAIDEVCALLDRRGFGRYLVEAGGELRARGSWLVAIEHPQRVLMLTDRALATSGTYRQRWPDGPLERSHLLDPRTRRPVEHDTVSVSVLAATCAEADAWATALNVLGHEAGASVAERERLDAQFTTERAGALLVHPTRNWPAHSPLTTRH
jgi:thiamine biosynthesis lipoprotein